MILNGRLVTRGLAIALFLVLPFVLAGVQTATADQTLIRSETIQLNVDDALVVHSDHLAIQQVFVEGNLSAVAVDTPQHYPAADFRIIASAPGTYVLHILFNEPSDYRVSLSVVQNGTDPISNSTSYYISGGSFELDVTAYFNPAPTVAVASVPSTSAWDNFVSWMGNFDQAFPLWVKALYLLLGVQFLTVGGLWIRRQSAKKQAATHPLDRGEKAYLWLDVTYKFLLTSFVAIVAIMGGELILLFVLRFMFLVSISLLSLWDLFVVGFAFGAAILAYATRFILERAFDLRPFEDE
jgi:hypothetical protein